MKILVKHNNTEIVIDDNTDETTIKYSGAELIKVLEKMSLEIQAIETNYQKLVEEKKNEIGRNFGSGSGTPQQGTANGTTNHFFQPDLPNSSYTKCIFCGREKYEHPKSVFNTEAKSEFID
jgi:hypothetical protein